MGVAIAGDAVYLTGTVQENDARVVISYLMTARYGASGCPHGVRHQRGSSTSNSVMTQGRGILAGPHGLFVAGQTQDAFGGPPLGGDDWFVAKLRTKDGSQY